MRPLNTKWKSTPGNFDPNHTMDPMPSDNWLGLPMVEGTAGPLEVAWSTTFDALRTRVRRGGKVPAGSGVVTFFTEDYRFEQCWTSPDRFVGYMPHGPAHEHVALTPDFSLYTDHPPAVHLWNLFRSRWLGAYWQRAGLRVVPTVSWADESSHEYCFLGLPARSVLAVSTVGVLRKRDAVRLWVAGFEAMVERLQPTQVLCCGELPAGFSTGVPVLHLAPFHAKF